MINCYFCKKEIKNKSAYISHLKLRKKPCIEDADLWFKQKKIVLDNFLKDNISFDRNQLNFINADDKIYDCIFTNGTTDSFRTISNYLNFNHNSKFI